MKQIIKQIIWPQCRKNLEIETIVIHEGYNDDSKEHDIALLKLKEAADLSVHMPACLPPKDKVFTGKTAWVYGWGDTQSQEEDQWTLRETSQTILSREECAKGEGTFIDEGVEKPVSMANTLSNDMICGITPGLK